MGKWQEFSNPLLLVVFCVSQYYNVRYCQQAWRQCRYIAGANRNQNLAVAADGVFFDAGWMSLSVWFGISNGLLSPVFMGLARVVFLVALTGLIIARKKLSRTESLGITIWAFVFFGASMCLTINMIYFFLYLCGCIPPWRAGQAIKKEGQGRVNILYWHVISRSTTVWVMYYLFSTRWYQLIAACLVLIASLRVVKLWEGAGIGGESSWLKILRQVYNFRNPL